MKTVAVLGATGIVGKAVVRRFLEDGHRVVGVARNGDLLAAERASLAAGARFTVIAGDISTEKGGSDLAAGLAAHGHYDVIVVAVNAKAPPVPAASLDIALLGSTIHLNLSPHLIAARHLVPLVAPGGLFLGIGGGMADLVFPGQAAMSIAQAGQRMLYRYLAKENARGGVSIRELLVFAMISDKDLVEAKPGWMSGADVATHLAAIVENPEAFDGPILALRSTRQIGQPEQGTA